MKPRTSLKACAYFTPLSALTFTLTVLAASAAPGALKSEDWPVPEGLKEYAVLRTSYRMRPWCLAISF